MSFLYSDNPHRSSDPGYLGSTSFSSTFESKTFDLAPETLGEPPADCETRPQEWLSHAERSLRIKRGAECLAWIEQIMPHEALIQKCNEQSPGSMLFQWIPACVTALRTQIYEPALQKHGVERENFLFACSRAIFLESWQVFEYSGNTTMSEFGRAFTGSKIRWETVGIVFTAFALASVYYKYPGVHLPGIERPRLESGFERRLMEASYTCLAFCEEAGHLTDPELWLQCDTFYLCTILEGDAGHVTWRRLGDLISCIVAKGLHSEITVSSVNPFWLTEQKKKTFANAYGQDKTIAALTGRPPRLARRYCHMQLPLDLAPSDLNLTSEELEERVNALDDNGWGQSLNATSRFRAALMSMMLKEDILDLALTTIPSDNESELRNLQQRVAFAWNDQPDFVKTPVSDENFPLRTLQMDYSYNQFLLQRVIVRKLGGSTDTDVLFRMSRNLLAEVLELASSLHSNSWGGASLRLGKLAADLPWLLLKNGLPAAGVLGLELLRRFEGDNPPGPNSTPAMCAPSSSAFSVSEAVQQLSVLAATIEWAVKRDHGNFQLLDQARRVVLRILERVLSPAPRYDPWNEPKTTEQQQSWWEEQTIPALSEVDFWNNLPKHPLLS